MSDRTPLRAPFHTTRWSVVLAAGKKDTPESKAALSDLCSVYWQPLYSFLRRRGTEPNEALDLVQGFVARLLEKGDLAADPDRGSFRSYLLGALKNYAANARRGARGPAGSARSPLSIDAAKAEQTYAFEPTDSETPERLFERQWATTVIDRAMDRLRAEYEERGRGALHASLVPALTGDSHAPYSRIAEELGVSESAIKVTVHRMRSRMRELVQDEVAQTVGSRGDVPDEMTRLLAALAS